MICFTGHSHTPHLVCSSRKELGMAGWFQEILCTFVLSTTKNMETVLTEGMTCTSELVVEQQHTAMALGSGDMPVLATPMMVALMENAAMNAVASALPEGMSTVGGQIQTSHLAPTALGGKVKAVATLDKVERKKLFFSVAAYEGDKLLGKGEHLRFIVEREKFLPK